ncbi:MAG TPA: hypothetical protein VGM94_12860 [Galbitalea sp.]|jgi:hypothetical protein
MIASPLNDRDRIRAKQLAMLDADIREDAEWETTMRQLVDANLGDLEFTEQRMAALKVRLKRRKREQAAIHYAYDPRRRRADLIEREIKKQMLGLAAKMEKSPDATAQATAQKLRERADDMARPPVHTREELNERQAPRRTGGRPILRSLEHVDPVMIRMISGDTGIPDLRFANDDDILNAYLAQGIELAVAKQYLATLTAAPA